MEWTGRLVGGWLLLATLIGVGTAVTEGAAAQGPPDGASPGAFTGRVLTPDGKPVAGATVTWLNRADREALAQAPVTTDAAGRFRLEGVSALRKPETRPMLLAEAAGWALTFQAVPEQGDALDVTLLPATEVRVPFLDPQGKPVPNLPVVLHALVGENHFFVQFPRSEGGRFVRRTDAQGIVTIPALPRSWRLRLQVKDERFARLSYPDDIVLGQGAQTTAKPIRLQPGGSIKGRITLGSGGKPAAGVTVGAQGVGAENGWGEAITDTDGRYHMTQLAAGTYNVALDLKGALAQDWTARAHEKTYVGAGEHLDRIDFTLVKGALIQGKVTVAGTGQPVPGTHVGVYGPAHPRSGAWVQGVQTGPDGTYRHRVPEGQQYLYISGAPAGFLRPAKAGQELTLKDGEAVTINFELPRGPQPKSARGRVLGPDDKPVAGAEVTLSSLDRFGGRGTTLRTDAAGAFVIEESRMTQPISVRARRGEMATPKGTVVSGGEEVTLRLQKGVLASITGRVTDVVGRPIADAEVKLIEWAYDSGSEGARTRTDDQGRYSFPYLWSDLRYSVDAQAEGFGHRYCPTVELRPGEALKVDDLSLGKADRSLAGRVVSGSGDPAPGIEVTLQGRESPYQSQVTDREGRFRFEGLVYEEISLNARVSDERWVEKKAKAGNTDVVLVLPGEKAGDEAAAEPVVKEDLDALIGQAAPPLQAVAWLNSKPRTLDALRGKVVLIDFWGIGCGPCVAALPGVQRAADEFTPKGAVVIGLHGSGVTPKQLREFAQGKKLTYPMAIDADDAGLSFGKTFRQYGIQGIPTVAIVDREGKVAYLGHSLAEAVGRMGAILAAAPPPQEARAH
jgi:thiol-disulfide isomerase/thioredoxin/protocatechuate 3,4-dioxygenase beta subunit